MTSDAAYRNLKASTGRDGDPVREGPGNHLGPFVTVYYKETPFELRRGVYTTEELVTVFSAPAGYLLDLIGQDGEFRELKPSEKIKIRKDMEFSSHPPAGHSS
jgi:hypothetical protein